MQSAKANVIGSHGRGGSSSTCTEIDDKSRCCKCKWMNPNPMFFQPLLPHFLNSFSIPISYMKQLEHELKGRPLESVVLMAHNLKENEPQPQPQRHWVVEIEGDRHFKQGWLEFAIHHDLRVGDFVVFKHLSHFLFQVSVYDPVTACQFHSHYLQPRRHANASAIPQPTPKYPKPKVNSKGSKRSGYLNKKRQPQADAIGSTAPANKRQKYPTCRITLTSYSVDKSIVNIPKSFVRSSGLENTICDVKLIDRKERRWTVKLSCRKNGQSYIKRGWKEFQLISGLKPGNVISFQLLEAGNNPVFKCYRLSPSRVGLSRSKARVL